MILWQLPQIIIGAAVLGVTLLRYGPMTVEYLGSVQVYRYRPKRVLWGVSFGPIIILADHDWHGEQTVRHEYGHSIQSRMLGPLYLIVVGIPSIIRAAWWWAFGYPRDAYYRGYPEAWADRLGGVERAPT